MFTVDSTESEVLDFLRKRFANLPGKSTRIAAGDDPYLKKRRRGRPRASDRNDIYQAIDEREIGQSIEKIIETKLPAEKLSQVETIRRSGYRQKDRSSQFLDPNRTYNEIDFVDAILEKDFNIAAAIFDTAEAITKEKIVTRLNAYYRHFHR